MTEAIPRKATDGITGQGFPIREATQVCRQKLRECATQALLQKDHWAENRYSDFNLWDSGIGACANELNCLDKRLESDISAQNVVIGALSTLSAWSTKCRELAEAEKPTTETMDEGHGGKLMFITGTDTDLPDQITLSEAKSVVEKLLRVLLDLEIAIRRAGTASRMRRADRTFVKRKYRYVELTGHLEFILRISGATRQNKISENQRLQIDVESALEQLQGEKAPLRPEQHILLLANVKRTDRFLFYKGRQEQLKSQQTQSPLQTLSVPRESLEAHPPDPPSKSGGQFGQPSPSQSSTPLVNKQAISPRSQQSTGTTNQASSYLSGLPLEKAMELPSPAVAATAIALRANYPKPPKDKTKCPYCLIPFKNEVKNANLWKKHVSEDLQPYSCYLQNCPQDNPFFDTFDTWKAHVLSDAHQQFEGWVCLFCQFPSKPTDETIFLEHIRSIHSDAVAEESLDNFVKICSRYTAAALETCPVCSTLENDWKFRKTSDPIFEPTAGSFLEHIGQCLHHFSLRVLPETEPMKPRYDSDKNMTDGSSIEARSWPSCSLYISHHEDAGLTETDISTFSELSHLSNTFQRIQTWVELAETMNDPDSANETIRLDPRYDMRKKEEVANNMVGSDEAKFNAQIELPQLSRSIGSKTPIKQLADDIESAFCQNFEGRSFLPYEKIGLLATEKNIRFVVGTVEFFASMDDLVKFIRDAARRLFLILVLMESDTLEQQLKTFQDWGFNDSVLPVKFDQNNSAFAVRGPLDATRYPLFKNWHRRKRHLFANLQWRFIIPVFGTMYFYMHIPVGQILPFLEVVPHVAGTGYYGEVWKTTIYAENMDQSVGLPVFKWTSKELDKSGQLIQMDTMTVAIVVNKVKEGNEAKDNHDEFFKNEAAKLNRQRRYSSPHLLKPITAYRYENGSYVMYPWADRGNLGDYLVHYSPYFHVRDHVIWLLRQFRGLCSALAELYSYEVSHGDLKPENILWFEREVDGGIFQIADLSRDTSHKKEANKEIRKGMAAETHSGAFRYQPPQMIESQNVKEPVSRQNDMWSLGCILFELLLWLTYSRSDVTSFRDKTPYFWQKTDGYLREEYEEYIVHEHVSTIMECLESHFEFHPAYRDLLFLVRDRLLVVEVSVDYMIIPDSRERAIEVSEAFAEIYRRCLSEKSYLKPYSQKLTYPEAEFGTKVQ